MPSRRGLSQSGPLRRQPGSSAAGGDQLMPYAVNMKVSMGSYIGHYPGLVGSALLFLLCAAMRQPLLAGYAPALRPVQHLHP